MLLDAMESQGQIKVSYCIRRSGDQVNIDLSDSGKGYSKFMILKMYSDLDLQPKKEVGD